MPVAVQVASPRFWGRGYAGVRLDSKREVAHWRRIVLFQQADRVVSSDTAIASLSQDVTILPIPTMLPIFLGGTVCSEHRG